MTMPIEGTQKDNVIVLTPVQSSCCAPAPASTNTRGCGCEPGKRAATVIDEVGAAVSACCGKPVNDETPAAACCG
jgi:hypothetical protein